MEFFYHIDGIDVATRGIAADVLASRRAGMTNAVTTIEADAKKNAPVRTSNLANSGTSFSNEDGTKGTIRFTAKYAEWVHEGTGLYGPHKQRIVPVSAKALFWAGAKHPVRSVAGMKGRPFLTQAADKADPGKLYEEGMANYLATRGRA